MSDEYVTARIENVEEIAAALESLGKKRALSVIRKSLRAGAKPVLARARAIAPVRTGATRAAIKIRSAKRKKYHEAITVGMSEGWFRGATFYAAFVEFGHWMGKRLSRKFKSRADYDDASAAAGRKHVPAHPFIGKAFDETKTQAFEAFSTRLNELLAEDPLAGGAK